MNQEGPSPTLPAGTVTFMFTDVEGSTRMLAALGERWGRLLEEHREIIERAVSSNGGVVVGTEGDATFAAFERATGAVAAAVEVQLELLSHPWPGDSKVSVRIGLHTGEAQVMSGAYVGMAVHQASRICAVGHGRQVLISRTTHDLVHGGLPEGVRLRRLGSFRLKDLLREEELFQAEHPDLPGDFPSPRTVEVAPNNLPGQLTNFVGRRTEMANIKTALSASRLLTLLGPGGAGKTRLAIQVARETAHEYPAGVWMADLSAVVDPDLVPSSIARVVGGSGVADTDDPLTRLVEDLSGSKLLLLLDNCEHLADACAIAAQKLLTESVGLTIVATSRERLGVGGEVVIQVDPMSMDSKEGDPSDAIEMFVERARSHMPGFELTDDTRSFVKQICEMLDGLPLAIELAASHVRTLNVQQIAERLAKDRFHLLTKGSRAGEARQQTLWSSIEWSYRLLGEKEQMLLARLAVFPSTFELEAAERVCSGEGLDPTETYDLLSGLVDKSFVIFRPGTDGARYSLLETIREYALARLPTPASSPPGPDSEAVCLKKEGEYWSLETSGAVFRMRSGKGLDYLSQLLAEPGREFHVLDLAGRAAGDAGALLDTAARAAYSRRLADLSQEQECESK